MSFVGKLLPYQVEAVDKMIARKKLLNAYEMGLGKTPMSIAAIEHLMDAGEITQPGLVICLSSLKYQWASSITKFTGGSSTPLVLDGTPTIRKAQYEVAYDWVTSGVDYIILNYEQVVNDWDYVKKLPRGFIILDEATAIKSFRTKRSRHVKKLSDAPVKFALTGTPIENGRPEELFSTMQFVDSTVLGRFDIFDKAFIVRNNWGGVDRYRNLPTLHEKLTEASIRKSQTDPDVAPYLPDAIHRDPIFIDFDKKNSKLYKKIVTDLIYDLEEAQEMFGGSFNILAHYGLQNAFAGPEAAARGKIMSKIGCLKMLCSHPDLLRTSADKYKAMSGEGSAYAYELLEDGHLDSITSSRKLEALLEYITEFLELDYKNKVVIFATYVDMLDKIAERLGTAMCCLYSGKMNAKEKEESKVAFNAQPEKRVFISSNAGGYGVDLPAANLLVNYDLPWSSGGAAQRNGRINRASSTWKTIVIQDILMSNSIEVRQHDALIQKNNVANAIIDGEGIDDKGGIALTVGSLIKFLRSN